MRSKTCDHAALWSLIVMSWLFSGPCSPVTWRMHARLTGLEDRLRELEGRGR